MTGKNVRDALNARLLKSEAADAVNAEITAALVEIAVRAKWPDLHTKDASTLAFTSGMKSKALPTDFLVLDRLYIAGKQTLEEMPEDDLRAAQETACPASGEPHWRAIVGKTLYVYPIPSASVTLTVEYWKRPAAVTDETAALVLGDEWREAVTAWSIVHYLKTCGFDVHPKLTENEGIFEREMAKLLPTAQHKVTISKPYHYV